nr:GNAT family N-acetyltransferase [Cellulomonas sp. KRMCY2]
MSPPGSVGDGPRRAARRYDPQVAAEGVGVEVVESVDQGLVDAWERLLPQLSRSAVAVTPTVLREIIESDATSLLVARVDGVIVGSLTLVVFPLPTGRRAWIEDVVVDEAVRGRGVGEALTRAAVARAAVLGARTVDLTSRPSRAAANRLYQRVGFQARETTVYRHAAPGRAG